jgi:CRP-like cAMP-binding protein
MSEEKICQLIEDSPVAQDLDRTDCGKLADIAVTDSLEDGQVLIREGEVDNTLHVVAEGRLAVERAAGAGEPMILHILQQGDLAGALGFVDGAEHTATLRALGKATVLSIKRDALEALLESEPKLVYGVMRGIIRSVHRIVGQMNTQCVELSNYIQKTHGRY